MFYPQLFTFVFFIFQHLVHEKVEKVMIYKLSNNISQHKLVGLIRSFFKSDLVEILLLVIDMQDPNKKEVVNHIRIMIEEEESVFLIEQKVKKLCVVLLHFPLSCLRRPPCYPSLFLYGWDHYYLDSIGTNMVNFDMKGFIWNCCFPQTPKDDPLCSILKCILDEAIPVLASRIKFGSAQGGIYNTKMSVSKRSDMLNELLVEYSLGDILCKMFRSYWKPHVMSKYLQDAVMFIKTQDSTLTITDYVYTSLKDLFFDFLVYMVARVNENGNIDVLFRNRDGTGTKELFLDIVQILSVPRN